MYRICLERIELIALVAGDFLEVSLGTFESLCTLPRSMRTRSIAPSPCSPGSTTHLHGDKPRWSLAHAHRAIFGGMSPAITCAAGYHSQVPCRIYAARATSHRCAKPRIYGRIFLFCAPACKNFDSPLRSAPADLRRARRLEPRPHARLRAALFRCRLANERGIKLPKNWPKTRQRPGVPLNLGAVLPFRFFCSTLVAFDDALESKSKSTSVALVLFDVSQSVQRRSAF